MPDDLRAGGVPPTLPASFFEGLIKDLSVETWGELLRSNPTLKAAVLEGFTVPANKLNRILRQPQIVARLQRLIRSDEALFNDVLLLWAQEQLTTVAFLEMLDRDFLLDNQQSLKDFIGPERFYAALTILGYRDEAEFQELVDEDFWERRIESELVVPITPFWALWLEFVQQFPQAAHWLPPIKPGEEGAAEERRHGEARGQARQLRELEERCAKLQAKRNKTEEEKSQLQQELLRFRKEQEELRARLAEQEEQQAEQRQKALADLRREWFKRYEPVYDPVLREADGSLESVLRRTEQAFALQRRADEEYGLVAAVRQKLIQVDLYLREIERIHAESLVVHSAVTRSKEALLQAKEKLLKLPGIDKVLRFEPPSCPVTDLSRQIRLLEALPENLPRVMELHTLLGRLAELGLISDPQAILEDVEHKKRQIMEHLYAQSEVRQDRWPGLRRAENLDDLVKTRESKRYDLFVDGYNILLTVHGKSQAPAAAVLSAVRERFTAAVVRKSQHFRKIYLVFDGQQDSRDRQGNTEIIFTDKNLGNTADAYIIQTVRKRKDRLVLIATADREIIEAIADRLYALVDPYHFYLFVHDMPFPELM